MACSLLGRRIAEVILDPLFQDLSKVHVMRRVFDTDNGLHELRIECVFLVRSGTIMVVGLLPR